MSDENIDPLMPCYMMTAQRGREQKQATIIMVRSSLDVWRDATSPLSLAAAGDAFVVDQRQDGTFPNQPG